MTSQLQVPVLQVQVPVLHVQTNDSSGSPPTSILGAMLSEPRPSTFKTSQIQSVIEDTEDSLPPLSPRQLYRPEKQEKKIRRGGKPDSRCTYVFPRDSKSKNKPARFRGDICGEKCFKPRADEHHTLPLCGQHKRTKKPVMTGATNSYGFTEGIPVSEESSIVGKLVPTDQLPKLAPTGVHVEPRPVLDVSEVPNLVGRSLPTDQLPTLATTGGHLEPRPVPDVRSLTRPGIIETVPKKKQCKGLRLRNYPNSGDVSMIVQPYNNPETSTGIAINSTPSLLPESINRGPSNVPLEILLEDSDKSLNFNIVPENLIPINLKYNKMLLGYRYKVLDIIVGKDITKRIAIIVGKDNIQFKVKLPATMDISRYNKNKLNYLKHCVQHIPGEGKTKILKLLVE